MSKVIVLRMGHRFVRDFRLTTHTCLVARALGAAGVILANVEDKEVKRTVEDVVSQWGGPFSIEMGVPWKKIVREWKAREGIICHLTMYGENIEKSNVLKRIKESKGDVLVVVGAERVPVEVFRLADFNVAISNQPHSECAALAVFLDRYFEGETLHKEFENARIKIIPSPHGKRMMKLKVS